MLIKFQENTRGNDNHLGSNLKILHFQAKSGYLTKEGFNVKNWKKRWFVLGKETLSYYKNQEARKVLGVILLREITSVTVTKHKKKKKTET